MGKPASSTTSIPKWAWIGYCPDVDESGIASVGWQSDVLPVQTLRDTAPR
jgi:hypothetical protein